MTAQSADEVETPQRAALRPDEWHFVCPSCEMQHYDVLTEEDNAGAICPRPEDRFRRCEGCGVVIEVVAVSVREAYPA